jgi:PST family polysaccharide transporter
MGFVLLAKGKGSYFVFTELLWNALFLITIWLLWDSSSIESTGIAFLIGYLALTGIMYVICKRICGFSCSKKSLRFILIYTGLSALSFINTKFHYLPYWQIYGAGLLTVTLLYSYYEMKQIVDIGQTFNKILIKIGLRKIQ